MKKRVSLILASVLSLVTLFSGCNGGGSSTTNTTAGADTTQAVDTTVAPNTTVAENTTQETSAKLVIGLVTDQGGVNDKSFNQSASTGIDNAVNDFGVEKKIIESKKKEDYEQNLKAFITNKADLICAVGFMMSDAVTNVSKQNPDSKFLYIDGVVDSPNVLNVTFKENEGSYLMGIIAAKMSKSNKIGFIGGVEGELIGRFEAGFAAGVKSINADAGALLENRTLVKYAGSFDDSQKGKELAKSLIDEGCDVIYHAAGGVGIGMFQAVQEARKDGKEVWAIGVDMDQAVTLPDYKDFIISSMMKRVDTATYTATKDLVNNSLVTGKHVELGLKEDGVGIAPTTKDIVPQDILDLVDKYTNAIKEGKFSVPATNEEVKAFTAPTI